MNVMLQLNPYSMKNWKLLKEIAKKHKFKVDDLLMENENKILRKDQNGIFMTSHSQDFEDIKNRMIDIIFELNTKRFIIWRYKIENVVLDSKYKDTFNLLEK